ncbi:MAG: hypothetical protein Ta2B_03580 [Termitinemataceae bacterium]|nr:MAG: hypothetical protein Ta2B_03580 [Termitinemataceae bacterium]
MFFGGVLVKTTKKLSKVIGILSAALAFGLLFIGCGGDDITDPEKKSSKTVAEAIKEINTATDTATIKGALETNAKLLGLDLTDYDTLSDAEKLTVVKKVLIRRPDGGYPNKDAIVKAFNKALDFNYIKYAIAGSLSEAKVKSNIYEKFGLAEEPTDNTDVTAGFNALHSYIYDNPTAIGDLIKIGDYIDLPSLEVAGDIGYEEVTWRGYISVEKDGVNFFDGMGNNSLRLIVVGINSFNGKNGNDTPHVVFHFKNITISTNYSCNTHQMNLDANTGGGYLNSEMRSYIIGNFLTGIKSAGVPEKVLWAPTRIVASSGDPEKAVEQTITDKLWLPTAWEMTGEQGVSVASCETSMNQASFKDFYKDSGTRTKAHAYFLASPASGREFGFCVVGFTGIVENVITPNSKLGCVPAFCLR